MKSILIWILLSLIVVGAVSAGTLESGTKMSISANYAGFTGLSLLGVWSTTPTTTDYIVIHNADLSGVLTPDGKQPQLRGDITVTVPPPIFEQVMTVSKQYRLIKVLPVSRGYFYVPSLDAATKTARCKEKMDADIATTYGGRAFLAGTGVLSSVGAGYCSVQFVLEDTQIGWYGKVTNKGWSYQQDIVLANIGKTLHLQRSPETGMTVQDQLTDKIDNVARVTLLGFSQWTNAPLSTDIIYAYNGQNVVSNGKWNVFEDEGSRVAYEQNIATLKSYFQGTNVITSSTTVAEINRLRDLINTKADTMKGIGSGAITPSAWTSTVQLPIRTVGNDIIAPLRKPVLIARIQMLFSGDSFGLYIPTGKPSIVSYDSALTFPELGSGYLDVKVKNIGDYTGTFRLQGACGGQIQVEEEEFSLAAGASKDVRLRHTGKSTILAPTQDFNCNLELKETNTGEIITKTYGVTLQVKQQCTDGEETDPRPSGDVYIVEVQDAFCAVKSTKTCPMVGYEFVKQSGVWVCKEKAKKPSHCTNAVKDADEADVDCGGSCKACGGGQPSALLMLISAVAGLAAGVWVFSTTMFLAPIKVKLGKSKVPVGLVLQLLLGTGAFILVFVGIPLIVKAVSAALTGLFTIKLFG